MSVGRLGGRWDSVAVGWLVEGFMSVEWDGGIFYFIFRTGSLEKRRNLLR